MQVFPDVLERLILGWQLMEYALEAVKKKQQEEEE